MYAQTCLGGDALGHVLNAGVPEVPQTHSKLSNISAKRQMLLVTVKIWKGSVPGILQARTLEWVAISFSNA